MDPITRQAVVAAAGAAGGEALYVDDVFSTYLYVGNNSTNVINNGIDLSGEGGLVWIKDRDNAGDHFLYDTERGVAKYIRSNATNNQTSTSIYGLQSFNSNGFTLGVNWNGENGNGYDIASWTFRKAPGFFDVVTWTTTTNSAEQIPHNLGSTPGTIIVKRTDTGNWIIWHRSLPNSLNDFLFFSNADKQSAVGVWGNNAPNSTHFEYDGGASGRTFVAYIFAHDDQSFGTNSDESIIKCGSYTGDSSTDGQAISLGFEPQWLMIKSVDLNATNTGWHIYDSMRGVPTGGDENCLTANLNSEENGSGTGGNADRVDFNATGFTVKSNSFSVNNSSSDYVYIAIRRPHKPPTAATEVFDVTEDTTATTLKSINISFPTDFAIQAATEASQKYAYSRLAGNSYLTTNSTNAESALSAPFSVEFDQQNTFTTYISDQDNVFYNFRRAPGFFDVVAYSGNQAQDRQVPHNLSVAPEMMIIKSRDSAYYWVVYHKAIGATHELRLPNNDGKFTTSSWSENDTEPTSSYFVIGNKNAVNDASDNFIAYLFATLDGISKVGSYSGTGSDINVDCGFTAGARFVLIKRTDSTGDWYVWDTERGIVSGNDPYLLLNSTAAEVTTTDYIDPLNAGFTVTSSAPAALNASGGTYLFLAIA